MSDRDRPSAVLYRMDTADHLCPFGLKAKALLERRGFEVRDERLTTREQAEAFKRDQGVDTTPQVFIEGKRLGGYDRLRERLGLPAENAGEVTYQPVLAVFGVTLLMAVAASWSIASEVLDARVLELFVAFSMCVLAILKLRDLHAFSNRFLGYDLLAQRAVRYAYVYPFAEAFAGIGMIAGVWIPLVSTTALFIGSIGAVSVVKAVYVDGRDLECACVGGDSKVPLGSISLTENLMMIGMGIWMLAR